MRRSIQRLGLWFPLFWVLSASTVYGQRDTPAELESAARTAAEEGRFPEAQHLFHESLEAEPNVATAFNYALVLQAGDETVAAQRVLEEIEVGRYGQIVPEQREPIRQLHSEVQARLGVLLLVIEGTTSADVRIDGEQVTRSQGNAVTRIPVNPGQRQLTVSANGYESVERQFTAEASDVTSLSVALRPRVIAEALIPEGQNDLAQESSSASPWPWILASAGAVAIIAIVVAVVVATSRREGLPNLPDNFIGQTETLSLPFD